MYGRATVVPVQGKAETDAVWDPLLAEPGREGVVRLSLPSFAATVSEYRD